MEAWATTAWTPGSQTRGSASGPGRSTTVTAPAGQAAAIASSTSPVVVRVREEGRARTLLPPARALAATRVGTHTGEFAACQPSTTPYGAHSSVVTPDTAGTARGRIASASAGRASSRPRADRSSRSANRRGWPASATAASTTAAPASASAARDRAAAASRASRGIAATAGWAAPARAASSVGAVTATAIQASGAAGLPPGLHVRVPAGELAAAWPALAPLQPVARTPHGVMCAPRCAPEAAAAALPRLPWPAEPVAQVPGWPDPPAAMVGGWYRRSPRHLAAPAGVRELVQVPGEGFGPIDHATTAMCLHALEGLPPGPAVDAGCGSGLLAQAWAALGRGPVLAVDVDPHAARHAAASTAAAGLAGAVTVRRAPIAALTPAGLAGRVLLANVPMPAHRELLRAGAGAAPAAAVLSGIRPGDAAALRDAWAARGLRPDGAWERDGWACLRLVAG